MMAYDDEVFRLCSQHEDYSIGCLAYGSIDILANQKSNADAIQTQFIRKIIIVGRSDRALSPESMVNVLILETPVGTQTRNI